MSYDAATHDFGAVLDAVPVDATMLDAAATPLPICEDFAATLPTAPVVVNEYVERMGIAAMKSLSPNARSAPR